MEYSASFLSTFKSVLVLGLEFLDFLFPWLTRSSNLTSKTMKLNLRLYAVAVLLASIFITLEPYQAMGWTQRAEAEANARKEFNKSTLKFIKDSHVVVDVNLMNLLQENKATIAQVEQALILLDRISNRAGDSVSIEITTNAPPGYPTGTPPGTPITILPTYDINDTIPIGSTNFVLTSAIPTTEQMVITPKFMVPACITIGICIVVLGFFIYLVYKICKGIRTLFETYTNKLDGAITESLVSPTNEWVYPAEITSAFLIIRTNEVVGDNWNVEQATAPYMKTNGYNPKYSYATPTEWNSTDRMGFVIESKSTLNSPWEINCAVEFTPNGIYSFSNHGINIVIPSGNTKMMEVSEPIAPSMFYRVRSISIP